MSQQFKQTMSFVKANTLILLLWFGIKRDSSAHCMQTRSRHKLNIRVEFLLVISLLLFSLKDEI